MQTEPEIIPPVAKYKRPTDFTDDIFQTICDRMAEGEGLREICSDPEMPSRTTFLRWVEKDTGRQAKYAAAREALMDYYAEEIRTIAWDDSKDTIKREGKPDLCNHEWINRSRLKVDTLKFLMAKLSPKKYGDKTELLTAAEPPTSGDNAGISLLTPVRVIVYPMLRANGMLIPIGTPEYDDVIEKATQAARDRGARETMLGIDIRGEIERAPAQIAYKPEPLPNDLSQEDWSLLTEVLNLIRRTIPSDSNVLPETIFSVIRQALLLHFREVEIDAGNANAAYL